MRRMEKDGEGRGGPVPGLRSEPDAQESPESTRSAAPECVALAGLRGMIEESRDGIGDGFWGKNACECAGAFSAWP